MTNQTLTIRTADATDAVAVERLAALDSASPPTGHLVLGEVGHELWAAMDLDTGTTIADPFRPSGSVVEMLRARAELGGERAPARRLGLRPRTLRAA
jgi:hypothetical protein